MDLSEFYGDYRADGHGRAAYEPAMMVTLLLYGYATKQRSSRAIERCCGQDVAYRVISGNVVPDHATIARFVVRHEAALAALFGEVLKLCDQVGLIRPGVIAIDGTRVAGNANRNHSRTFEQIAREVIAEAKATDETETERLGDARGDELPEQLRTPEGRREFFARATQQRQQRQQRQRREQQANQPEGHGGAEDRGPDAPPKSELRFDFDAERIVARTQGRGGWLREAQHQLEHQRWQDPEAIPRSRSERLALAAERLEEELEAQRAGNAAYEHYRQHGGTKNGRALGAPPKPYAPPETPPGQVNLSDPDSKLQKTTEGYLQGYNAQASVDEGQIVLAAEVTNSTVDWSQLDPMVSATQAELGNAGVSARPDVALADAQYWNEAHMDEVVANKHIQVLIPPDSGSRKSHRPGRSARYTWMRYVLASSPGRQLYRRRKHMIEPVFGHTKHNRQVTRFLRRGRTAVRTEWRLLMATHNLTKLHRHEIATARA
jgi:transposase